MKFDLFAWSEVAAPEKWHPCADGRLRLRFSEPGAVFCRCQGYEVLAGYGTDFDLTFAEILEYRCSLPKGGRVFGRFPGGTGAESTGEVYTNADRSLDQSGTYFEVRRALREQQIAQHVQLGEMRAATRALKLARLAMTAAVPAPADPPQNPGVSEGGDPPPAGEAS